MPAFQEVYNKYRDKVVLISVATDSNNDPENFVKQNNYNWLFAYDTDGANKYSVQGIPTTIFITADGTIKDTRVGGMDATMFESKLRSIL